LGRQIKSYSQKETPEYDSPWIAAVQINRKNVNWDAYNRKAHGVMTYEIQTLETLILLVRLLWNNIKYTCHDDALSTTPSVPKCKPI
jgi:hypothetical protein